MRSRIVRARACQRLRPRTGHGGNHIVVAIGKVRDNDVDLTQSGPGHSAELDIGEGRADANTNCVGQGRRTLKYLA